LISFNITKAVEEISQDDDYTSGQDDCGGRVTNYIENMVGERICI